MSQVYEELALKSRRLQKLFGEIEQQFDQPDVTSVESFRLTESLGVKIDVTSKEPLIVSSVLQQAKYSTENGALTAQIKSLKESSPIGVSVGNSPAGVLRPSQLHKKVLPELLKADLWNRAILEKGKLAEVLALVSGYKQVEKDGVKYFFDEDLDWLIQEDANAVTVYGKSEKYGLLKEVREKIATGNPANAFESLRTCLAAEIDLLERALSSPSFTHQRRELMSLELATDTIAAEFLD
ncbi:uncharacterized protein LOC100904231 [Galendromus occidentalis]|uniref:Uncharacterized protein LOC100904231 n=1 Tax=Galendromus occidentalis TaxID=34638 RepID=A0AAJ6VYZ7_9ACAR|nr:uncharacterized protein LOC100904231 [Galendromus occidentalis]XP_018495537.1 uncharacterized protein LOC100904231 [Galendromus occidentalis]